ncbi:TonB family C-terminal domain-containing protein [Algoriphagus winogradskyi]|uniref:TonB family C-terminal domain-containing protein n=2 Tax=Algoriphagus winogradskyi TaxID=237017 RepID=A0ABY1PNJ7_9BACT|nr:TonB family C-terminal domain-containing protein [Algoriphagus winogradskyi]
MSKYIILFFLMAFIQNANCQELVPLNAHKFSIKDTLKYKPSFYGQITEDSDSLYSFKTFDTLGNLSSISRTWLVKEKKHKVPVKTQSVSFSNSGDTLQMSVIDLLEQNERIFHYDEGVIFSEVYREKSYFISGWEISPEGNKKLSLDEHRFTPRLMNIDELGIWLRENMKYPKLARRKGIEGTIYMILTVDSEGNVKEMEVGNPEFEPLFATEALRVLANFEWDFEPKEDRLGNPVEGIAVQPILFKMSNLF